MASDEPRRAALGPLIEQLIDEIADAVASRVASRLNEPAAPTPPTRRLLTLEQLVDLLPAGKSPSTWRAWLYQRTRLAQVPGCVKLGGRLFFDPEATIPWLLQGAERGCTQAGLDLAGEESLHQPDVGINVRSEG